MIKKYFFPLLLLIFLITSCQTIGFDKTLGQYFEDYFNVIDTINIEVPKQYQNL